MAPRATKSKSSSGRRVKCGCGCGDLVHPKTERNHLRGRALPHIRASAAEKNKEIFGETHRHVKATNHGPESGRQMLSPAARPAKRHKETHNHGDFDATTGLPEWELDSGRCADELELPQDLGINTALVDPDLGCPGVGPAVESDISPSIYKPPELADIRDSIELDMATRGVEAIMGNVNRRVTVEDVSDEDEDSDPEEEREKESDGLESEGGLSSDDEDELDTIDERFEQELADFGKLLPSHGFAFNQCSPFSRGTLRR